MLAEFCLLNFHLLFICSLMWYSLPLMHSCKLFLCRVILQMRFTQGVAETQP